MSERYPGGLITKTPVTPSGPYETSTASGIWTLDQQAYWQKLGQWPSAGNQAPDAQFNYVTMLLHGDGTNGAQNNTFLDSSTNNYTITRYGNTTQGSFSPYGSNWSNYFDGASALSFSIPAFSTGPFTIEFWVYPTSFASLTSIYSSGGDDPSNLRVGTNTSGVLYLNTNGTNIISAGTLVANTWQHVAFVRNGTTLTVYLNGQSQGTATYTTNLIADTNAIGASDNGAGTLVKYYSGYISNLRLNYTAVYTSNFTPSTTPLTVISGTGLLTCQSNRFVDTSGNYGLTPRGAPSVQRFNPFGASTAYDTSVIGGSGYFDGTGDYLEMNSASGILGTVDWTIEYWWYPTASQPTQTVIWGKFPSGINNSYGVKVSTSTANQFGFSYYNGGFVNVYTSTLATRNAWHHVAVTRSGTSLRQYVNGTLVSTSTLPTNFDFGNLNTPTQIGFSGQDQKYPIGYLGDMRVLVGTALYTGSTYTIPTAPLTAITNTRFLGNFTNGAIFDNAMMNDLETVGSAQISTSVVKYGTGSVYINSASAPSYLTSYNTNAINLGTGDFTIEAWIYPTQYTSDSLICKFVTGGNIFFFMINSGQLCIVTNGYTSPSLGYSYFGALSLNTWTFITLTRVSGTCYGYINGTKSGSSYSFPTAITPNQVIVGEADTDRYIGYIDDFRITKGYARYTATFTPPTQAFPNIGPT